MPDQVRHDEEGFPYAVASKPGDILFDHVARAGELIENQADRDAAGGDQHEPGRGAFRPRPLRPRRKLFRAGPARHLAIGVPMLAHAASSNPSLVTIRLPTFRQPNDHEVPKPPQTAPPIRPSPPAMLWAAHRTDSFPVSPRD